MCFMLHEFIWISHLLFLFKIVEHSMKSGCLVTSLHHLLSCWTGGLLTSVAPSWTRYWFTANNRLCPLLPICPLAKSPWPVPISHCTRSCCGAKRIVNYMVSVYHTRLSSIKTFSSLHKILLAQHHYKWLAIIDTCLSVPLLAPYNLRFLQLS